MEPPTYPARPTNGGSLPLAPPKRGVWFYEPKVNGNRAMIHRESGKMWNRFLKPLTFADKFTDALSVLKSKMFADWFDCEVIERKGEFMRGTIIVLDYIPRENARRSYFERYRTLKSWLPVMCLEESSVYILPTITEAHRLELWKELAKFNKSIGEQFYDGVVAKRGDSSYPAQLLSPIQETRWWVKHCFV